MKVDLTEIRGQELCESGSDCEIRGQELCDSGSD